MSAEDEIKKIQEELDRTKYNKHTQYHIGQQKAKLSRLKDEQEVEKTRGKAKGKAYSVRKSGDATVLLVGYPSVGKSTLLNSLTNADSKIGDYEFTTLDIIPGMLEYNSALIQVLDIPGMIVGASTGKGRGKEILSVVRNADLVLILVDKPGQEETIRKELYTAGFRLNKHKPDVQIHKTNTGGIKVSFAVKKKKLDVKMVKLVLGEIGIHNAEIIIRDNIDLDELIDCASKNRIYVPSITIQNKADLKVDVKSDMRISSKEGYKIEDLKKLIWKKLKLIRVYMKKIGKEPDMKEPLIIKSNPTVVDVCKKIHKEFAINFDYARVWGSSKFEGQIIGKEFVVKDKDIVELHMK